MHRNSELLFRAHASPYFKDGITVLEIGADSNPSTYQKALNLKSVDWQTLDISAETKPTILTKNEYQFPIPENTYDVVLSGNVIEHVKKIWLWVSELSRICKKGGAVITVNPLSWPFHEYPVDCWRIYPEGMKALYEHAGLEVVFCSCENRELASADGTQGVTVQDFTQKKGRMFGHRRLHPGIGNPSGRWKTQIKKLVGWPTPTAFDTITIGIKK